MRKLHLHVLTRIKQVILITSFALSAWAETAGDSASNADNVARMLMLIGQCLLFLVAILVALAWIWFPFMVKHRLDKIIRKLNDIEQLQAKLVTSAPKNPSA